MKQVTVIDDTEWDALVKKTYDKPYAFQKQDGCKERGTFHFSVPYEPEDYENDAVPEEVNHEEMGVSFQAWLDRSPEQLLSSPDDQNSWSLNLWWERNFYPHVSTLINDLHQKGILQPGNYAIDIDW